MHELVSYHEKEILSGLFDKVYQGFSRPIVVWKEPIAQSLVTPSSVPNATFGFGQAPVENQYVYIPVSGVYPAVVRYLGYRHIGETEVIQDTNSFNPIGEVKIKVRQDCYDFIENGQTDKISFDNRDWYFVGKPQANPFMGSLYYFYQLKPLK